MSKKSNESFTITAPPSTDIWRKPPSTDRFNAPTRPLLDAPMPLSAFNRAHVTFSAPWCTRYDQGGLLLHLTKAGAQDRWLKTGVEFYEGRPSLSTVATRTHSDWSLAQTALGNELPGALYSLEVRRERDELGSSLWVYEAGPAGRRPLREVCWFFAEEEGWTVDVRAMAARPAEKEGIEGVDKELVVTFHSFEVDVVSDGGN